MIEELNGSAEKFKREKAWIEVYIRNNLSCERCNSLNSEFNPLTVDHIIPDSILKDMGFDPNRFWDEENYQPMCRRCNAFKANRLDFADARTKPLLLKYLNTIT